MPAQRKRPWFLVLALLGALALGATGSFAGCGAIALYREPLDLSAAGDGIGDEHDREAVVSRAEAEVRALDAAKSRGWPLAVATLLVGGATLVFAVRAMAGRTDARAALVQLVVAQAALTVATPFLVPGVVEAGLRLQEAELYAQMHPLESPHGEVPAVSLGLLRTVDRTGLVLRTLAAGLVVLALTRRRSREFFEGAAPALEES